MPLDPQVQALLEMLAASEQPLLQEQSVAEARAGLLALATAAGGTPEAIGKIEDRNIPGPAGEVPIRIYTPEGAGPFPILLYFHGGGWVIGSLETHDVLCRALTNAAQCVTISVDYRLAPEDPFPAAPEDCYAALQWTVENAATLNGDTSRVAVGGDSAGGNLAAVVALMARDHKGPALVYQLLIYPVTDYHTPGTPSYVENADGYFLTRDDMVWFWNHYILDKETAKHPYASPLQAENVSDLPPAMVITAEFDPLRDEGELYAEKLRGAGVIVSAKRYDGMIHGFASMGGAIEQGKKVIADIAAGLRAAFAHTQSEGGFLVDHSKQKVTTFLMFDGKA